MKASGKISVFIMHALLLANSDSAVYELREYMKMDGQDELGIVCRK